MALCIRIHMGSRQYLVQEYKASKVGHAFESVKLTDLFMIVTLEQLPRFKKNKSMRMPGSSLTSVMLGLVSPM